MGLMQKPFADLITFTRSTGGGRFNAAGQYEWLPANTPRIDYDPVTGECLGLLIEEQRTNLLTYSSDFSNAAWSKLDGATVIADASSAPDGTMTADKVTASTTSTASRVERTISSTTGANYAFSIWLRADSPVEAMVTLGPVVELVKVTTEWKRFVVIREAVPSQIYPQVRVATGVSVYAWGAQLEQSSQPSSYIPTTDAQVTRAADIASVNELSPWYSPEQGTLFVEWSSASPRATGVEISDGSSNNRIILSQNKANEAAVVVNGNFPATGLGTATTAAKVAIALRANDVAVSINGAPALVDVSTTIPAVSVMNIGRRVNGAEAANGHIRSIRYFPRRLSNTELQALTA